jgi:glycosyltransferase involved in cell wall biosynthesis
MDGGSDDTTTGILKAQSDTRLRWWSEPDRGQSHALNKALALSRGDIIGWLNSDDAYFGLTVIQEVVEMFDRRPEVAVVYGHGALANADGLILHLNWTPPFSRRLLLLHDYIPQPAAFIRRSAVGQFLADEELDFAMDYDLWLRLSATATFARIDRIIAIDRHHDARKSTRMLEALDRDRGTLRARYGIDAGFGANVARKLWKIISRFAGAVLLRRATRERLAFDGWFDRKGALVWRQIGARRASMPLAARREPGRRTPTWR